MLELNIGRNGNIFELPQDGEAVCVTTNGVIKANGCAVMGAGIAKQADDIFHISPRLGMYLKKYGNRVFNMGKFINASQTKAINVITFPTKHHWKDNSDITLIIRSAEQLMEVCTKFGITKCYLTPPGCGCGKLNWETTVKPWLSQILDDRFVVVFQK
jgi:hypothetical protein